MSTSVAPSDSVSSTGRKNKPGKRERQEKRSQVGASGGMPASPAKAAFFASGGGDPIPQPGKFPIVFDAGVGEPTRDVLFSLAGRTLSSLTTFARRYEMNPKHAEFLGFVNEDNAWFAKQLETAAFLRCAQQVVHSHVNMDLPQGDFAPVASSDVRIPSSMATVIQQLGEFSLPSLGSRFLLAGYADTVRHLIEAARARASNGNVSCILDRFWVPQSQNSWVSRYEIGAALRAYAMRLEVTFPPGVIEDAVLSGTVPLCFESIKGQFGDPPAEGQTDTRDRFDFLFKRYANEGALFAAFALNGVNPSLTELGLKWPNASAGHMRWGDNPKVVFSDLADDWARKSAAFGQFFEMSSGVSNRSAASGSQCQLAEVSTANAVTVVSAFTALSAPQFSLSACFPVPVEAPALQFRNVVKPTSVNVSQRGTEFVLGDWR